MTSAQVAAALYCTARELETRAGLEAGGGAIGPTAGRSVESTNRRPTGPLAGRPPLKWPNKDGSTGYLTHEEYINLRRRARGEHLPGGAADYLAKRKAAQKDSPITKAIGLSTDEEEGEL